MYKLVISTWGGKELARVTNIRTINDARNEFKRHVNHLQNIYELNQQDKCEGGTYQEVVICLYKEGSYFHSLIGMSSRILSDYYLHRYVMFGC